MPDPDPRDYIDLDAYPIDQPDSPAYATVIDTLRNGLESKGCAVLQGFIRGGRMGELVAEAQRVAPAAHRSFNRTNVYFTRDDPTLPADHPLRRFYARSNAFVPADNFQSDSILRAIYEWSPFGPFIQAALDERKFYRYADPLADVIINVVEPGGGFPWHFDTNNYTVTLAIRGGESGGLFEYRPHLRNAEDENYTGVKAILDGARTGVESLALGPGDLQLFKGRYALHRVTPVGGAQTRFVAIFSYAEQPGMVASPERCKQLYGRVLAVHRARAVPRADQLVD